MLYSSDSKFKWGQMPSGLIVPADCRPKPRPKGFDFFAGCGGFSCGFKKAGFQIIGALEMSFDAAHTYMVNLGSHPMKIHFDTDERKQDFEKYMQKHFNRVAAKNQILPVLHNFDNRRLENYFDVSGSGWISNQNIPGCEHFWIADIKNLTGKEILNKLNMERGELDVVIGGPPCQGFSRAGKQDEYDPRNVLIWEYGRMILELNPKSFVMEEVPDVFDFHTPEGINIIDGLLKMLADGDFAPLESLRKAVFGRKNVKAVLRQEKKHKVKKEKLKKAKTA